MFCVPEFTNLVIPGVFSDYSAGSLLFGPLKLLEQYSVVPCHHKKPILATNCLRKMAVRVRKGKFKYLVATQVGPRTSNSV